MDFLRSHVESAAGVEALDHSPNFGPVPIVEFEQQTLEVTRHLYIHAGAYTGDNFTLAISGAGKEARQNVVGVGRHEQVADRQAEPGRNVAGIDVAEVSRRDGKGDGTSGRTQGERGKGVVDGLRHNSRPIDRIYCRQIERVAERQVSEHCFDQGLAIVERSVDGDIVHVRGIDGGHLPALHLRDPAMGMQNNDGDRISPAAGFDGGGSGIAGRGAENRQSMSAPCHDVIEQSAEKLQSVIFERQCRSVEQLHQPQVLVELDEGRRRRVIERGVAFP